MIFASFVVLGSVYRSVVVVATAHVFVRLAGRRGQLGRWQRLLVQVVLQDREHVPIAARASEECTCASGFEARVAIFLCESEQPEARAVAPLRVPALAQNHIAECACASADGRCPAENARRSPFGMGAM